MTHVHYKFSSKLSYNTVVFDGPNITLCELKRLIMAKEKLRATDCDLQITNAQSKEEYTDDDSSIPKGSSVIVRRVPCSAVKTSSSANNSERSNSYNYNYGLFKPPMDELRASGGMPLFSKMADLASADISEDNKIKVMMTQSCYDSANYKRYGTSLPANYTCYRCGSMEHHIRNCPVKQDKNADPPLRIKKSTGIPRSFMVHVDDPSIKGAMLTNSGHYAIHAIDAEAYAVKKRKTPTQDQQSQDPIENHIPGELLCLICQDLLDDAVVIPCCGNSYCDDCIRTALLDSDDHVCPTCNQSEVSPDTLIANKFLRQAVNNFKKEQVYTQSFKKPCSTSQSQDSTPRPSPAPSPLPQSHPEKSQTADTPTVACSDSTPSTSSTSQVVEKVPDETPDTEAVMKTNSILVATSSVLVSDADTSDTHSQPIPLVTSITQTTTTDNASSSSVSQTEHTPCWDRSTSASPSEGWTTLNTHHPTSSSLTSSFTQSPDITPSHLQTYLSVQQQPLSCYPPGFSTVTPSWTPGPSSQGAPIPSFTLPSPSIPPLVPKEWFTFTRRNNERTPPRGSTYSSSSRLSSRSHKSKSSRSSSRSPPRSRSHSKTSHRSLSSRSHSSHSYSYGYKRSHSPTSSSSPRTHHNSRSKSPSDYHSDRHHGHHHNKRSTSSSSSSSRRGEGSNTSRNTPEWSLDTYLRWKQEYKDWCEKYFNSYFSHFHQMPPPPLMPPHWPSPSHHQHTGHSSPSSDSHSSTLQSYSESSSTTSMLSNNSHSSTSFSDSHSSTTQSSSDATPPSESCTRTSQEPSKPCQQRNIDENQNKESKNMEQNIENNNLLKLCSKKKDEHLKSKSFESKRKDQKLVDKEKEKQRRDEKKEKRYKEKASQKTANIDAHISRQRGHSKSHDSRSDKSRKRKNEEAQTNQRENILTEPLPSLNVFPKALKREKQKEAFWKPRPVTEEDLWEGGVKVKPQKKISINISLDTKKNEEANQQDAKPKSSGNSKYFEFDKEGEELRDDKNDSWEISAEDEAGEDSDLWQCALTSVVIEKNKPNEKESTGVKEVKMNCEQKEDQNGRPNVTLDISCTTGKSKNSGFEDDQKTMIKSVEEYMNSRSMEKRSELVQLSTPSRWQTDVPEEEQQATVHSNYRDMRGGSKIRRLVEIGNSEAIADSTILDRNVVPSSGQDIADSCSDFDRKRKKRTEKESESRKEEDRGHHSERETVRTFYSKSSSAASQAFTSILEEQNYSKERRSRQIYMELDIKCRGKYDHNLNSHQDSAVNHYSTWTLQHSQSYSRDIGQLSSKISTEESLRQNWTSRSQLPAALTAGLSLDMALDTDNKKEGMRNERREERMQDRQTRSREAQADLERPNCSTNAVHDDGENERKKDKKKEKAHIEKKHRTPVEMKKSTKKKPKDGRLEDFSKGYIFDKNL